MLQTTWKRGRRLLAAGAVLLGPAVVAGHAEPVVRVGETEVSTAQIQAEFGALEPSIIDRARRFYAPPAARMGINPEQLIVVQPENKTDEIWALDQSIRCRAIAAVLWRGGKLGVRHIRRLQLACENNESLGLLLRPDALRSELAAPAIRLLVEAVCPEENLAATSATAIEHSPFSRARLRISRLRGNPFLTDDSVELEIDDETGTLFEALPLPLVSRGTPGATQRE